MFARARARARANARARIRASARARARVRVRVRVGVGVGVGDRVRGAHDAPYAQGLGGELGLRVVHLRGGRERAR